MSGKSAARLDKWWTADVSQVYHLGYKGGVESWAFCGYVYKWAVNFGACPPRLCGNCRRVMEKALEEANSANDS